MNPEYITKVDLKVKNIDIKEEDFLKIRSSSKIYPHVPQSRKRTMLAATVESMYALGNMRVDQGKLQEEIPPPIPTKKTTRSGQIYPPNDFKIRGTWIRQPTKVEDTKLYLKCPVCNYSTYYSSFSETAMLRHLQNQHYFTKRQVLEYKKTRRVYTTDPFDDERKLKKRQKNTQESYKLDNMIAKKNGNSSKNDEEGSSSNRSSAQKEETPEPTEKLAMEEKLIKEEVEEEEPTAKPFYPAPVQKICAESSGTDEDIKPDRELLQSLLDSKDISAISSFANYQETGESMSIQEERVPSTSSRSDKQLFIEKQMDSHFENGTIIKGDSQFYRGTLKPDQTTVDIQQLAKNFGKEYTVNILHGKARNRNTEINCPWCNHHCNRRQLLVMYRHFTLLHNCSKDDLKLFQNAVENARRQFDADVDDYRRERLSKRFAERPTEGISANQKRVYPDAMKCPFCSYETRRRWTHLMMRHLLKTHEATDKEVAEFRHIYGIRKKIFMREVKDGEQQSYEMSDNTPEPDAEETKLDQKFAAEENDIKPDPRTERSASEVAQEICNKVLSLHKMKTSDETVDIKPEPIDKEVPAESCQKNQSSFHDIEEFQKLQDSFRDYCTALFLKRNNPQVSGSFETVCQMMARVTRPV